jgi:hypothetical protein
MCPKPTAEPRCDCSVSFLRQTTYQLCRQKSLSRHNSPARGVRLLPLAALSLALIAAAPLRAAEPNQLTPEQIADGWVSLFDGETFDGWQPTSDADWTLVDGEIRVSSGEQGWLMTNGEYADYELHVEFKAPATTNSGVFVRTPLEPTDPTKDCAEINIAPPDNPFPTASLVGRRRLSFDELRNGNDGFEIWGHVNGRLRQIAPESLPQPWDGQWHAFDIHVKETILGVALDGVSISTGSVFDYLSRPGDPTRGHIGLQFREGEVAFRSIRIREVDHQGTKTPREEGE